ncbi:type VI secretion system lipoprotein TssJ [Lysobacter sp. A421]
MLVATGVLLATTAGCSSQGGVKKTFGDTLQAIGLKQPPPQQHTIALRLYAADNLNAGDSKRALSLVVRVYQLRERERFDAAAFDVFLDEQRERDVLGDDLLAVTEFLLAPGQRHEVLEHLPAEGNHLGVVALFRAPAPTRWRYTFDADQAAVDGITLGLHACAMTTRGRSLETPLATPSHSLSSTHCTPPSG